MKGIEPTSVIGSLNYSTDKATDGWAVHTFSGQSEILYTAINRTRAVVHMSWNETIDIHIYTAASSFFNKDLKVSIQWTDGGRSDKP